MSDSARDPGRTICRSWRAVCRPCTDMSGGCGPVLTLRNRETYDRLGRTPHFRGNAAAPSCVDMNRKTRSRPALRERHARFRRAVRNAHVALAVTDESHWEEGSRVRGLGRAGGERRQHGRVSV